MAEYTFTDNTDECLRCGGEFDKDEYGNENPYYWDGLPYCKKCLLEVCGQTTFRFEMRSEDAEGHQIVEK